MCRQSFLNQLVFDSHNQTKLPHQLGYEWYHEFKCETLYYIRGGGNIVSGILNNYSIKYD